MLFTQVTTFGKGVGLGVIRALSRLRSRRVCDLLHALRKENNLDMNLIFWMASTLVCLSCCNKITTNWVAYKQQKFLSHSSGGWKSAIKGQQDRARSPSDLRLLTVSTHGGRGWECLFYKHWCHSWGLQPHDLSSSQRPHLLLPSSLGVGIST